MANAALALATAIPSKPFVPRPRRRGRRPGIVLLDHACGAQRLIDPATEKEACVVMLMPFSR